MSYHPGLPSCATCLHFRPDGHQRDGVSAWGCGWYSGCKGGGCKPRGWPRERDYGAEGAFYKRSEATQRAWEQYVTAVP